MNSKNTKNKAASIRAIKQMKVQAMQQKMKIVSSELKKKMQPEMNVWLNEYCSQMFFLS